METKQNNDVNNDQATDSVIGLDHIDFKDIDRLEANINPHARILGRKRTGMSAKGQRDLARAIKRARFMALMPYIRH